MKQSHGIPFLFCLLVLLLSLSCSLTGGLGSSSSGEKYLGDEYRSEGGGFSFRKAKDYDFKDVIGIVNMIAPGGNEKVGPGIMVMGGLTAKGMTTENLMEKISAQEGTVKVLNNKQVKVTGIDGIAADVGGSYEGQKIKGRLVVAMVTDEQQFTMMGFAPEEKWKDVSPVFDAVLDTVKFFEPNPEAGLTPDESMAEAVTEEPEAPLPAESEPEVTSEPEYEFPTARPGEIRQWAISAKASSQYGNVDWAASQATGEPDVYDCGDNTHAWASYNSNTVEWIELTYEKPVTPTEINIYQSYNPSQVIQVQMTATDGSKYIAWSGYPEEVENCPDLMTITIDLSKKIKVNKIRITVDQRVNGWGWDEIDAVELVGLSGDPVPNTSKTNPTPKVNPTSKAKATISSGKPAPTNYSGWMAGKNYQGFVAIVINKTTVKEIDGLIGLKGRKSTENYKPRPDHKDTYIYDFPDGMKAYVGVLTNDVVYKKLISPADAYPKDFKLATVTKENYQILDSQFKKNKSIPYADMANLLKSPGFIRESYISEGKYKATYEWYAANGDRMSGFFIDGSLTGMAGLAFIPKSK